MMFTGYQLQLMWAFIFASFTSGAGLGYPFQGLYFVLIVIFGSLSNDQFIVFSVIYIVAILYNSAIRGAKV